jgi:predicted nucleotidyltransferase
LAVKPEKKSDMVEVVYTEKRWRLLKEYRAKASQVISVLNSRHLGGVVYGSISRGDVNEKSDVDVFVPDPVSSFLVETTLEQAKIPVCSRMLIQATPSYGMKAFLELDEVTSVSFPLMRMRRVEREFYKFSGEVSLTQLSKNIRVSGVDKRLMLIEPSERGHFESSIVGREEYVSGILGIAVETVLDRVHTLIKRDTVGRTGVFIKRELSSDETFELALKKLAENNPAVRRRQKGAG